MGKYKKTWLSHLNDSVPLAAQGSGTCMYIMALEGWRRGLELKFMIKDRKNLLSAVSYSLSDGKREHVFHGSRGDLVSNEAIKICSNKGLTNKYLSDAEVSIPEGKSFTEESSNEQIIRYSNSLGYPLVLKPNGGEGGVGVITNIKNTDEMRKAVNRVRDVLDHKPVIVERFFVGEDFRVYVLSNKVIGAFHRRAASVVGDGKSCIEKLLEDKNSERQISPFLATSTIRMDKHMKVYLKERGLSSKYIPKKGERIFLRRNGEFFSQRDAVNVTETLSPKMKEIAISAVKAIPGLKHGGVDMLIDLEKNEGIVNEVNSRAQISNHVFPVEGEAVDIPKHIIDYYFPETKDRNSSNVSYHYDFKTIMDNFDTRYATEIKIRPASIGQNSAKQYLVTGRNLNNKYRKRLQREAREMNLNGYVRTINKDSISVVVSGSARPVNSFKNILMKKSQKVNEIQSIETKAFNRSIKVGFELRSNAKYDMK